MTVLATPRELPSDLLDDMVSERVRWDDFRAATVITLRRSWDEVDITYDRERDIRFSRGHK